MGTKKACVGQRRAEISTDRRRGHMISLSLCCCDQQRSRKTNTREKKKKKKKKKRGHRRPQFQIEVGDLGTMMLPPHLLHRSFLSFPSPLLYPAHQLSPNPSKPHGLQNALSGSRGAGAGSSSSCSSTRMPGFLPGRAAGRSCCQHCTVLLGGGHHLPQQPLLLGEK